MTNGNGNGNKKPIAKMKPLKEKPKKKMGNLKKPYMLMEPVRGGGKVDKDL